MYVPRPIVDASKAPWNAVGSISIEGRRFCTATLVAPDLVVTAAHCLWNAETNRWIPPRYIHFLAGYQQDDYSAHRLGAKVITSPHYNPKLSPTPQTIQYDWAIIQLQKPVPATIKPMPIMNMTQSLTDQPLALVGYRSDSRYALTIDQHCQLLGDSNSALLHNSCDSYSGDSGGPLLMKQATNTGKTTSTKSTQHRWALIGINIGRLQSLDQMQSESVAISIQQLQPQLQRLMHSRKP